MSVIANFLRWRETARVPERIAAAAALSRAYIQRDLTLEQRMAAQAALTLLLDDPSPKVRIAMSEALCTSTRAPLEVVTALAGDQHEVAAPVILHSPLLTDSDLINILTNTAQSEIQAAVASRAGLSQRVIATLADVACARACAVLVSKNSVHIPAESLRRMIERHGDDCHLRSLLLKREGLPAHCRHLLLQRASEALSASPFVAKILGAQGARAVVSNARSDASLALVDHAKPTDHAQLVARMREAGELTSSLLVRAVAYGKTGFLAAALSSVTGTPEAKMNALLQKGSARSLLSVFRQAGLRAVTHEPILTALKICRDVEAGRCLHGPQEIARSMLATLEKSTEGGEQERIALASLLRRIFLEELRRNARSEAWALAAA
ncbi:DUF2336 domain-containing protein [Nitratireductor aestuarii]|uniref:DUF2336 domain-containing protein n=1 Tax=Nitratireductor aestuarii TaxID=1735103 RepID=UPI00166B5784|nr:DUF2336 domain-containing protein [Nitratireductor aestuarii]